MGEKENWKSGMRMVISPQLIYIKSGHYEQLMPINSIIKIKLTSSMKHKN